MLALAAAAAFSGLDPATSRLYLLFAAGVVLATLSVLGGRRPDVVVHRQVGPQGTAGEPLPYRLRLRPRTPRVLEGISLRERLPRTIRVVQQEALSVGTLPEDGATISLDLLPSRRGVHHLEGPEVSSRWPFGLVRFGSRHPEPTRLVIHPRIHPIPRLDVPVDRRYQPGGIPLASATGDSCEFLGTREYREGDSLRTIHWKSWARHGSPVVIEYQEEYFSRLGVILDTFARPGDEERLEVAVSTAGSLIARIGGGEHVLDLFISGNTVYRTGRHLTDLSGIMEVLASVEPSREEPFTSVQARVLDSLEGLSMLLIVLLRLDPPREALLRRLRECGTRLKVFLVGGGGTGEWGEVDLPIQSEALGERLARL